MTHEEKVAQWIAPGMTGVEIGPGSTPIPGFTPRPIYVDCYKEFGAAACQADYYGHACALPFHSNSLDYVASSHVLEHVANPVAALAEWYRVLRPGGLIYLVVPNRLATWDHTRALTSVDHMLRDFEAGTTGKDASHIDEFLNDADWSRWMPNVPANDVAAKRRELSETYHAAVRDGLEINIHFHTFERSNLLELLERLETWPRTRFKWEVVDDVDAFPASTPNGVFAAIRVHKRWIDRAQADAFDVTGAADRRQAAVRPDAIPFAEFARPTAQVAPARA